MAILVFIEARDGAIRRVSLEVLGAARSVAAGLGGAPVVAVLPGHQVREVAALGPAGADRVLVYDAPHFRGYTPDGYAAAVAEAAGKVAATAVLFPASAMGKDLAPRVAARLGAGLATDCTGLRAEGGELIATRPVYAGKVFAEVAWDRPPQVASLRPKIFEPLPPDAGRSAAVETLPAPVSEADLKVRAVETVAAAQGQVDLTEAEIIVSGGRGMKGPEGYGILEQLAGALGGVVGASRAAVDAGWRPHADQVGQTGKTVSPKLYVACGISGAIQHLAGMSGSRCIVAINKDGDAPIFKVSDYGVVGDLFEVVPALTEQLRKLDGR
ncbi:MAG TPA: electron transfer flavoprotein subunit alpha/FixB family protein [Candidatus Saccharimonadales bacterium]|nr:electron transfer flavoprotein subunit alpha/FixB family protein [Candidatus Saccharimonadales bacterium]